MQKFNSSIEEVLPVTKSQLDKLHGDITSSLAKISTREKHINSQLEPLLINFRNNQVPFFFLLIKDKKSLNLFSSIR